MMGEGFDQVGRRSLVDGMDMSNMDGVGDFMPVLVNNIVFCRNPSLIKD